MRLASSEKFRRNKVAGNKMRTRKAHLGKWILFKIYTLHNYTNFYSVLLPSVARQHTILDTTWSFCFDFRTQSSAELCIVNKSTSRQFVHFPGQKVGLQIIFEMWGSERHCTAITYLHIGFNTSTGLNSLKYQNNIQIGSLLCFGKWTTLY